MKHFLITSFIVFLLIIGLSFTTSHRTCSTSAIDTFPATSGIGQCGYTSSRQLGWPSFITVHRGPITQDKTVWQMNGWGPLMLNALWAMVVGTGVSALWARKK